MLYQHYQRDAYQHNAIISGKKVT